MQERLFTTNKSHKIIQQDRSIDNQIFFSQWNLESDSRKGRSTLLAGSVPLKLQTAPEKDEISHPGIYKLIRIFYLHRHTSRSREIFNAQNVLISNLGMWAARAHSSMCIRVAWSQLPLYETSPIQIYWKFYNQKQENFQIKKFWYFSYFCSKHRLWVLIRTASPRRF